MIGNHQFQAFEFVDASGTRLVNLLSTKITAIASDVRQICPQ